MIEDVLHRIEEACVRAHRHPKEVKLVAVSKGVSASKVKEAYDSGVRLFGENYVQEALSKIAELTACSGIEWHMVGALQSNKAKQVVGLFSLIHSLDRWSLASELNKESRKKNAPVRALIEVNIADESSKGGVLASELVSLARRISQETELTIDGLMVFPPLSENSESSRPYFRKARELARQIDDLKLPRISGKELSMGVTSDFEIAIEEGATLVRIGTAIFGPREAEL